MNGLTGNYDKCRQLGRVPDAMWAQLKAAAARAGVPFTKWAVEGLLWWEQKQLQEAERCKKKK
jgi:hypothetical protein